MLESLGDYVIACLHMSLYMTPTWDIFLKSLAVVLHLTYQLFKYHRHSC